MRKKHESNKLAFIFETPKIPILDATVQTHQQDLSHNTTAEMLVDQFSIMNVQHQNGDICNLTQVTNIEPSPSLVYVQNPVVDTRTEAMEPQQHQQDNYLVSTDELSWLLNQIDADGLVESTSSLTQVSNANTYEVQPVIVYEPIQNLEIEEETPKGTKHRPENPTDSDGQFLSNSVFLSKGGAKASNFDQASTKNHQETNFHDIFDQASSSAQNYV